MAREPSWRDIEVVPVHDPCDVSVDGVRYCTGQFESNADAAAAYEAEGNRCLALAEYLRRLAGEQ